MTDTDAEKKADGQDAKLSEAFDRLENKSNHRSTQGPGPGDGVGSTSSVAIALAIFLSLVAIGVASYPAYELYKQRASNPLGDLASRVGAMTSLVAELQQKLEDKANSLDILSSKLVANENKQSAALESLQAKLESSISDLQSQNGTTSQDWLLAEVEYLLRLANQRVLMERDPVGAIGLFEAADSIIADSQGLTAFSLRQAMAADMARLEAVKVLDKEGLYLRLAALVGQVENLKQRQLAYIPSSEVAAEVSVQDSTILGRIMEFASKVLSRLASLVDFRRSEIEITPILPPAEAYYLRQNLILKLQMAQIALLENNGDIFSLSLRESSIWIGKYFDADDGTTSAMRTGLDELSMIDVQRDLPDVSASLREVRALLSEFHQATVNQ